MPDFGIFRGFNDKLFGNKLYAGQLPTQLGTIGSIDFSPFLLDLYPSAAAAYSLRKLRSDYTGFAIRVRRSSDNAEQNISFTSNGDLDISALTAFCGSGNGFVKTWFDQSGNSLNFDTATTSYQPQIIFSGTFNGYLQTQIGMPGAYQFQNNTSLSYFAVFQNFGSCMIMGNGQVYMGVGQNGNTDLSYNSFLGNFTNYSNFKNGTSFGNTRDNFFDNTVNFSVITIKVTFLNTTNTNIFLGDSTFGLNANRFKELLIYNNQTVSQSNVENNMKTYYGF